jgi:hypothetical protein
MSLASYILDAHAGSKPVVLEPPAQMLPGDMDGCFAVQREIAARRTELLGPVGGYKVGWGKALGHDGAVGGPVHAKRIYLSGAKLPSSNFSKIGIEVS